MALCHSIRLSHMGKKPVLHEVPELKEGQVFGPRLSVLDLNTDKCVVWPGATRAGYGIKKLPGNKVVQAHRWIYEQVKGKIPKGRYLDHKCLNRKCVNPEHMRVATPGDNVLYSWAFSRKKPGSYRS